MIYPLASLLARPQTVQGKLSQPKKLTDMQVMRHKSNQQEGGWVTNLPGLSGGRQCSAQCGSRPEKC